MKTLKLTKKVYPAQLWKRALAYLIDSLIISTVILYPFNKYLTSISKDIISILKAEIQITTTATLSILTLTYLYFVLMEGTTRQTIGKMMMNVYITSTRKELNITQILLRNITKPFTIVLIIDTLYMIFKRVPQRLFDTFAGTTVVEQGVEMK